MFKFFRIFTIVYTRSMNPLQLRRLELAMRTALDESGPLGPYKERHAWELKLTPGLKRGVHVWLICCPRCGYMWRMTVERGGLRNARSTKILDQLARVRRVVDRYLPWAC